VADKADSVVEKPSPLRPAFITGGAAILAAGLAASALIWVNRDRAQVAASPEITINNVIPSSPLPSITPTIEGSIAPITGDRQTTKPSVISPNNAKDSVSNRSELQTVPASELAYEGFVTSRAKPVPHQITSSVVLKSGRQLNPLETALIVALRSREIGVDEPVEPVNISIEIVRQENPPAGAAMLVGTIEFKQASGANCRFSVVHSETRFSPNQSVFTPVSRKRPFTAALTV
jgi:hypothetical protein